MLRNYVKIAIRNLLKQRVYSFVNLFGLAIGLACFVLIMRYVQYELSFDTFHERPDHIFRIVQHQPGNMYLGSDEFAVTPAPLARTLMEEYPEITVATTINDQRALLSYGDDHYYEDGLWADRHLFDVFTFPLLEGDPETALSEPGTIILTQSLARKIFGDEDPMGKTIIRQNQDPFTVTGIAEDVPPNSHITFSFITPLLSESNYLRNLNNNTFNNNSWYTYFTLQEGVPYTALQAKMPAFALKYLGDEDEPAEERSRYNIQPLKDIHLRSHVNFEISANNDIKYIYLFSGIAFVILLLACVNYMNLAIARSIKRYKEVGLRKVVGAHRAQLILQFIGESVLLSFLALSVALGLVLLVGPGFSAFVERDLSLGAEHAGWLLGLAALTLLVGVVSGSYPAVFVSSLKPAQVLKGSPTGSARRPRLQQVLVVAQYAASIILVVGSLVIHQQLSYIQHKEMGYNRDHIVVVRARGDEIEDNYETLRAELLRNPNILAVATSGNLPSHISSQTTVRGWEGSTEEDEIPVYQTEIDYDFLDVFEVGLAAGRNFSRDFAGDTLGGAYLLNETAVRGMGWGVDDAVGKRFEMWRGEGTVVGVLKDFHMHSLHMPIQPLAMLVNPDRFGYISVKVRGEDLPGTLAALQRTYEQFTPYPFDYEFFDDAFDELYATEIKLGESFGYFTLLALLIASLGLFGLAAFTAEQRTKEIGVRKVLGASVSSLVVLLSGTFTRLVLIAFVFAVPLAYIAMNRWLEAFAYRINIGPGVFLLAVGAVLVIAWLSVSYQAFKAARVNPVVSLKYE